MPAAIILAGGRSSRMGQDKASLVIAGKPLLQHVIDIVAPLADEVIVVTRPWQLAPRVVAADASGKPRPVIMVEDAHPGKGPIAGLHAGLSVATSLPALVVACDMPLLQPYLLKVLLQLAAGFDAVVPTQFGVAETLCAVYSGSCLPAIRAHLGRGDLRMSNLLKDLHTYYLDEEAWQRHDPEGLSFFNLNTPDDLARARSMLAKR